MFHVGPGESFPPPKHAQWGTMQGYMYMYVYTHVRDTRCLGLMLFLPQNTSCVLHAHVLSGSLSKLTPHYFIFNFPEALFSITLIRYNIIHHHKQSCDKVSGKVNISLHDQVQGPAGGVSDDLVR